MKLESGNFIFGPGDHVRHKQHGWLARVVDGNPFGFMIMVRWEGAKDPSSVPADQFDLLTEREYTVLLAAWSLGVTI